MSSNPNQSATNNSGSVGQEQSSTLSSAIGKQKKSAPEYPPATERSQRTNSANFGESKSDEDTVTF